MAPAVHFRPRGTRIRYARAGLHLLPQDFSSRDADGRTGSACGPGGPPRAQARRLRRLRRAYSGNDRRLSLDAVRAHRHGHGQQARTAPRRCVAGGCRARSVAPRLPRRGQDPLLLSLARARPVDPLEPALGAAAPSADGGRSRSVTSALGGHEGRSVAVDQLARADSTSISAPWRRTGASPRFTPSRECGAWQCSDPARAGDIVRPSGGDGRCDGRPR